MVEMVGYLGSYVVIEFEFPALSVNVWSSDEKSAVRFVYFCFLRQNPREKMPQIIKIYFSSRCRKIYFDYLRHFFTGILAQKTKINKSNSTFLI
jgi:hypothetical protein